MRRLLIAGCLVVAALVASPAAGEPAHPFGSPPPYAGKYVAPAHPQSELDRTVLDLWRKWRDTYLVPGCVQGTYRVRTDSGTSAHTVSEGQGYGMVLTAVFRDRAHFDGLYRYYRAHPSSITPGLMAWAQDDQCNDVQGADSATDGDLDIAYALLLADRQWGSKGQVDYARAAQRAIDAIRQGELSADDAHLQVGDWAPGSSYADGTRLSDQMTGHLKAFAAKATSHRARWRAAVRRSFATIASLRRHHARRTGLMPDFAVLDGRPQPAPSGWLEGPRDGQYSYNACRVPWRMASDYLTTGDPRAGREARAIARWARRTTHGHPARFHDGYTLRGRPTSRGHSLAFLGPVGAASTVDLGGAARRRWVTKVWDALASAPSEGYYGDSLRLLSMLVMSGNWWRP